MGICRTLDGFHVGDTIQTPQKSIKVHSSMVIIAITPVKVDSLVSSTRWVKFLRYQVRTPQTEITTQRAYQRLDILPRYSLLFISKYCCP